MELTPRQKSSWRFLIPIFLVFVFLSLISTRMRRAPWYEQIAWNTVQPVTSFFSWFSSNFGDFFHHYVFLTQAAKKNEDFQMEIDFLRQKLSDHAELKSENDRLRHLLDIKQKGWPSSIAARVIAFDPRSEFRTIRIDKGSKDGIQSDMPVIAPSGLVGKVGPVFKNEAIILLITDPNCYVDVLVQRSRVRALMMGSEFRSITELKPGFFLSRLEYVDRHSDLAQKDIIITSGLDQLYPKGILVGEIELVKEGSKGIFREANIVPAVDFSQLEEVLVLPRS